METGALFVTGHSPDNMWSPHGGHMVSQDHHFWWNWSVNLAVAVGTFMAVVVALFGEMLRARLFQPRLNLSLVRKEGERSAITAPVPGVGPGGYVVKQVDEARYYHLRVSNEQRWPVAEGVQVYLTRIEEPGPSGAFQVTWLGNVPMRWRDQEFVPLLRTIGPATDCDLCMVLKSGKLQLMPLITPNNLGAQRSGNCQLVVSLQARSNQRDSEVVRIRISWDGKWEDGDAEMQRHLVVDDVPRERERSV
jgi:hypothetical protein